MFLRVSEFKFACPVCGQHMMCDSSQAGTVMDCPTCFQKITAPQAPAPDAKFILTGTKVTERITPTLPADSRSHALPEKSFVGVIVVGLILVGMAAAATFVYRGTIFKNKTGGATINQIVSATNQNNSSEKKQAAAKPKLIAPPASDTNWILNLDDVTNFPDAAVAGRIHGQDFICERASFYNGTLIFRAGTRGPLTFGLTINFSGALAEALTNQIINVGTNTEQAARVTLHWQGEDSGRESFESGYALRLEFGALANNHLSGKIYLCLPDEQKSYIAGTFNADARKPKPKTPKQ
jgi:hypothetical protein